MHFFQDEIAADPCAAFAISGLVLVYLSRQSGTAATT
jgi:hypothetical protein